MKKFKLIYMLKDCDFFGFKDGDSETGGEEAKEEGGGTESQDTPGQTSKPQLAQVKPETSAANDTSLQGKPKKTETEDSAKSSILHFLFKKVDLINSTDDQKKNKFLISKLLKSSRKKVKKKESFHYKIKNLNRFFHPKRKAVKKGFRRISYKIQENLRYNGFPNIYSDLLESMQVDFESIPPQVERVEPETPSNLFSGMGPEKERLPADEETILPFDDILRIAENVQRESENPFFEILPLGVEPI